MTQRACEWSLGYKGPYFAEIAVERMCACLMNKASAWIRDNKVAKLPPDVQRTIGHDCGYAEWLRRQNAKRHV